MLKLRKNVDLSAIPLIVMNNTKSEEFSLENIGTNATIPNKDKYDRDCGECEQVAGNRKRQLCFSKIVAGDKAMWTFFLNVEYVYEKYVNAFIIAMSQVKDKDIVFIHGPAYIDRIYAEAIHSVISSCKAKVYMSNPYVLCAESAYLLTAADVIVSSPYMHMRIGAPCVGGYGKAHDAINSIDYDVKSYDRIYLALKEAGFIDDEDIKHLIEDQGMVSVEIGKLTKAITDFNAKHNA